MSRLSLCHVYHIETLALTSVRSWYTLLPYSTFSLYMIPFEPPFIIMGEVRIINKIFRKFKICVDILHLKVYNTKQGGDQVSNLKMIREHVGISQASLAEKSEVSIRMISFYEQGAKDINKAAGITLYRLAQVLGCKIEDLLELNTEE